jgi:hypothetical protein
VDRADRSAATIRKALRIACRMFTRRANVNDFCSDAILARDRLDWNNLFSRTQDFFELSLSDETVCRIRPRSYTPVNRTIRIIGRRK